MLFDLLLRFLYFISRPCAFILHAVSGRKRTVVFGELKRILAGRDTKELEAITRKSFEMYFKKQFENILYGWLTRERMERLARIEGIENLDKALRNGKGAVILLSHFGSHLLTVLALAYRGYEINQLTGPPLIGRGLLAKLIFKARSWKYSRLPVKFLRSDQSLQSVFKALRDNEVIALAFDGRVGKKWVPVRMFGMNTMVSPGALRIASIAGAPIVPAIIVREAGDRHRIILEEPVECDPAGGQAELQVFAEFFEKYIKAYPDQYGIVLQTMRDKANKGTIEHSLIPGEA